MSSHRSVLWCALLAVLPVAEAAASSVPNITAGEARLTLSTRAASTFPIDVQALAATLCGTNRKPFVTNSKCHLVAPPERSGIRLTVLPPLSRQSAQPVQWQITALNLPLAQAVTTCGVWNASMSLDANQPTSLIRLTPAADDPGRGHFTSTLQARVHLHLTNPATRQAADYPLVLGIGLAGSWHLASPGETSAAAPGTSNLRVLNGDEDEEEDCLPAWVADYPELLKEYLALNCEFCPEDPSQSDRK